MERLDDQADTSSSHPPKRQKTRNGSPIVRHDQYTIAWICALPIEMAAAHAMLDTTHEGLPTNASDTNTYLLGSIKHHNVVIACLPADQYGTNNAAIVITNLRRTFSSIRAGLMVGIGGGAPSMADVRLGDVVVGTRVTQHDFGKIVGDGQLQRTAISRIPHQLLGTAVTVLRSTHGQESSRIPSILQEKLKGHPDSGRPSSPDRLFQATYDHEGHAGAGCDGCDESKLEQRDKRISDNPVVHYGAIASGNQVMRNGRRRDEISRQLDVLCFEMEAAGLMDVLPCLPIRGICDYSDSHKSKEWQGYAAATAAAYATELLEVLPVAKTPPRLTNMPNHQDQALLHECRQRLLDSLRFDKINSRKQNIKRAHRQTCQWFLDHPDYRAWLDPGDLEQHSGFLWISGKPGAGKSTIMKFIYSSMKKQARHQHVVASFFFNARGEDLEKSILGMYRSILLQLLEGYTDLQTVLDDDDLVSQPQDGCPPLNVLKELFFNAVSSLGERSFTCFIDALDECDEQQVVDMVQCFEELAEQAMDVGIALRICFSSRPYPYVEIRRGIRLTLEEQAGHATDLDNYITSRLRINDCALVEQLLGKAAGVFLWVVLVVEILNQEMSRGGLALEKRLADIPSGLSELFKNILTRDKVKKEELLLCILWILCAKRPLQPKEFYHAFWSGALLKGLVDPGIPDVTLPEADGNIKRCVISSSKGLAEITKDTQPTVQFIHESVRDFLIKDGGLHELWPDLGFNWESRGHETLKEGCNFYMNQTMDPAFVKRLLPEEKHKRQDEKRTRQEDKRKRQEDKLKRQAEISIRFPFLDYASQHVLCHADAAADAIPQDEFLTHFLIPNWVAIINSFEKAESREYRPDASLFYLLADRGFSKLIRTRLKKDPRVHVSGGRYRYPLFAALANGNRDAVAALLNSPSSICNGVDIMEGLNHRKDLKAYQGRTPLSWAAQDGRAGIVKLLLQTGADANTSDNLELTPLFRASENGHEAIVRLLVDKGADIKTSDKSGWTPLLRALVKGHEAVARLLIDKGADVDASDSSGWTPLLRASANGHEAVARLLLDKGADVDASDSSGRTPLSWASANGHEAIVRLLIDNGADVNTSDKSGLTPLIQASKNGDEVVAKLLIDKGADIKTSDKSGRTPLLEASANGHEAVARLLIDKGADVDASDSSGRTPLLEASANGHEAVARLLIDKGADVDASESSGWTPLSWASAHGHEAVARLLLDKGADVDASDSSGRTPLSWASAKGHEAVARLLIDKGADVDASDSSGWMPLSWASAKGHEAVARLLIDKGADVDASNDSGWTPLSWASAKGHEAVARLLIDKGADVDASDGSGRTPLSWASANGHEAVARLLIDKGADIDASDGSG